MKVAIVNPTATHKESTLLRMNMDMLFLAETSAVERVQLQVAKTCDSIIITVFSAPVQPNCSDARQEHSGRGLAGGVALMTRLPARRSPEAFTMAVERTTRITEAFVKFGAVGVRCICLYVIPQSHADAKFLNRLLLEAAFQIVSNNKIPSVIAGDMNIDVTLLEPWDQFVQLGFVEAFQLVHPRFGKKLPPTCKQATRFDTVIMSPCMASLLCHAEVLVSSRDFDAHAPLVLEFAAPHCVPALHRWALPKPWTDFAVSPVRFEEAYLELAGFMDE